jgi:hypothetical protein
MPSGGFISGIPSAVEYADYLITWLPDMLEDSMNETLEEHVNESREYLKRDAGYSRLAQYYDVVEDEDEQHTLVFGLFDVPAHLQDRATALEFGDATTPPRAFVRRTLFKEGDKVANEVGKGVRRAMGEVVADA